MSQFLNLGCGDSYKDGWVNADLYAKRVDKRFDFDKFPYPFKNNYFDQVFSRHALEHLKEPIKVIEELWRITKPFGQVTIIVPHYSSAGAHTPLHRNFWGANAIAFAQNPTGVYGKHNYALLDTYIRWQAPDAKTKWVGKLLNPLINSSIPFFERFWCYWVGGAYEIEWVLRVEK